jgi:hypothetical protein
MATSASTLDNNLSTGGTNSQGLANWAGDYTTDMLGKTKALSGEGYQTYQGPLTAGASDLQNTAFTGLAGLTVPTGAADATKTAGDVATTLQGMSYDPTQFTNQYAAPVSSAFDQSQAQNYMNPYLQMALNPQIEEARRQSLLTQLANDDKATQSGAFGGGRAALMNAETQRNLGTNLSSIVGKGYSDAYDKAVAQFNAEQNRKVTEAQNQAQYGLSAQQEAERSRQFGSKYGMDAQQAALLAAQAQGSLANTENQLTLGNLKAQLEGGAIDRGITSEGIAADKAEFEKQRDYPKEQLKFEKDMLAGLPIAAVTNTPGQLTDLGALLKGGAGAAAIAEQFGYKNSGDLLKDLYGWFKG